MNPWPVEAATAEVHLPRPGHADLVGTQKYGLTDVRDILERASARETAARVAGGAVCKAFLQALGVDRLLPRDPDHRRHRAAARRPHARGLRARRRVAGALPRPRRDEGDGRRDRPAAQGERVARRRVRGPGVRARARARLARLLGGAARRPARAGDPLDPGDQGGVDRGRVRGRRRARLAGPR